MTQVIAIHSFRGGTGKSNITANSAALLASGGARVAVIDTDIQSPGIHVLFGVEQDGLEATLNDYLWGNCDIEEAAFDVSDLVDGDGGLFVVPSSNKVSAITRVLQEGYQVERLNRGFRSLIRSLKLDYLLIDTHPGLNEETLLSVAICDSLLLIIRPDQQDYQGASVTLDVARKLEVPNIYLAVNKAISSYDPDAVKERLETVYKCPVATVLPLSEELAGLGSAGLFCMQYPDHPITEKFVAIATCLRGQHHEMLAV